MHAELVGALYAKDTYAADDYGEHVKSQCDLEEAHEFPHFFGGVILIFWTLKV